MRTFSIDVNLLDKSRFKEVIRKDGTIAKFYDFVMVDKKTDFSDFFVTQSRTKEESESKVKMPIIGNGKIFGEAERSGSPAKPAAKIQPEDASW